MQRRHSFALMLMACFTLSGTTHVRAAPDLTQLAQAQPAPAAAPQAPAAPPAAVAADPQTAADEPIGNVATLTGTATLIRNKNSLPVKPRDDVYLNDVLQTSADSTLGVTFNDATTFNLTANARITVDSYVYEDGGKKNTALFDITRGTVAFVAAAVAKAGDMKITTPTATLGIRGTTGLVEVPEGAAAGSANNVAIKLYPDADGRVGRIEVNDRAGARLGFLTQGASGFTIRPGAMGRVAALPLAISPQQAQRDQGFVRQVHAAQSLGRQVVTEQRALRRANPALNNPNRANPPRPGGALRPNALPKQNNLQKQQPGLPGRQGLQPRSGSAAQPATPAQPGALPRTGAPERTGQKQQPAVQPGQPGLPNRPGAQQPAIQQNAPGAPKPGSQNRPGLQKLRPALPGPKGKKEKR
jgi:hypothetical protein